MAVEEGLVRNFVPSFLNIVDLYLYQVSLIRTHLPIDVDQ
jgi:hypothetical protein